MESIFLDMPTVGYKKSSFVRELDQSDLWQGSIIFWGMKRPIKNELFVAIGPGLETYCTL